MSCQQHLHSQSPLLAAASFPPSLERSNPDFSILANDKEKPYYLLSKFDKKSRADSEQVERAFLEIIDRYGVTDGLTFVLENMPNATKINLFTFENVGWLISLYGQQSLPVLKHYFKKGNSNAKILVLFALSKILPITEMYPYLEQVAKTSNGKMLETWTRIAQWVTDPVEIQKLLEILTNFGRRFPKADLFLVQNTVLTYLLQKNAPIPFILFQKYYASRGMVTDHFLTRAEKATTDPDFLQAVQAERDHNKGRSLDYGFETAVLLEQGLIDPQKLTAAEITALWYDTPAGLPQSTTLAKEKFTDWLCQPEQEEQYRQVEQHCLNVAGNRINFYVNENLFRFLSQSPHPEETKQLFKKFIAAERVTPIGHKVLTLVEAELLQKQGLTVEAQATLQTALADYWDESNSANSCYRFNLSGLDNALFLTLLRSSPLAQNKFKQHLQNLSPAKQRAAVNDGVHFFFEYAQRNKDPEFLKILLRTTPAHPSGQLKFHFDSPLIQDQHFFQAFAQEVETCLAAPQRDKAENWCLLNQIVSGLDDVTANDLRYFSLTQKTFFSKLLRKNIWYAPNNSISYAHSLERFGQKQDIPLLVSLASNKKWELNNHKIIDLPTIDYQTLAQDKFKKADLRWLRTIAKIKKREREQKD